MSKRIDKKRQRRQADTTTAVNTPAATPVSVTGTTAVTKHPITEQIDFFIQYQNLEYLEKDIIKKIKEKCKEEGIEINEGEKLSIYLKPEERKAYFTYAGFSSFIEI